MRAFAQFMGRFTPVRLLSALAVLIPLAGCIPESVETLPRDTRIMAEKKFIGTWKARALGTDITAVITRGEGESLKAHVTGVTDFPGEPARTETADFTMTFHRIDETFIVALLGPGQEPEHSPVYRFASYRFGGDDSVALFFMGDEPVHFAVYPNRLAGAIRTNDPNFHDILLRAAPRALANFIHLTPPAKLFTTTLGPFARQ